jgi:hypothetical protein
MQHLRRLFWTVEAPVLDLVNDKDGRLYTETHIRQVLGMTDFLDSDKIERLVGLLKLPPKKISEIMEQKAKNEDVSASDSSSSAKKRNTKSVAETKKRGSQKLNEGPKAKKQKPNTITKFLKK